MADPYEKIQEDTQRLKDDVTRAMAQAKEDAKFYGSYAAEQAKEKFHEGARKAKEGAQKADEYAHEHAWLVAGVAALFGLVIGMLFSSRHRRDDY